MNDPMNFEKQLIYMVGVLHRYQRLFDSFVWLIWVKVSINYKSFSEIYILALWYDGKLR